MMLYDVLPGPADCMRLALSENGEWGRMMLAGAVIGERDWSEEFIERRKDRDADDQHRAELDSQPLLQQRDLAFQFHDILLGDQPLLHHARLFPGQDFGLGLGHARPGQALDEVMRVECNDVRFHEAQGNARHSLLQAMIAARMPPGDDIMATLNKSIQNSSERAG